MRFERIGEALDQGMLFERSLNDAALHAAAAAVNQSHFPKPCLVRRVDVLFDDRLDVPWMEGMQIERVLYWDDARRFVFTHVLSPKP
jgi:hypothetical protein